MSRSRRNTPRSRTRSGAAVVAYALLLPAMTAAEDLPSHGRVHALVLFARFADESARQIPAYAADLFDPDLPGSLSHFFHEMSRGQFELTGQVLPALYAARDAAAQYAPSPTASRGGFGRFAEEILDAADADVDYGRFDNDGPDGVPNSGDDDGTVDLVLIITQSTPTGFIVGDANGVAVLGLSAPYRTDDASALRGPIRVRPDQPGPSGGTLQRGRSLADAVGIIAHEMGHVFGLPDLYDRDALRVNGGADPEEDSAGIGSWGLMGHGATGWDERGGPTPYCAWSLLQLGWLGRDNERLVRVEQSLPGAFFADVNRGGNVYQVALPDSEYLLLEHRRRDGSYYERDLPAEGLLIWHVRDKVAHNDSERAKVVDLVCADGLYADAGFPLGQEDDPDQGRDNLDFWAHDVVYRQARGGNLGDAGDPFDGVTRTDFTPVTNPAINRVSVNAIRRVAGGMAADIVLGDPRRAGRLAHSETWRDTIDVLGDVFIPEGLRLDIAPGTLVRFGSDARRRGADPERTELLVAGRLEVTGLRQTRFASARANPQPGDWTGVIVARSGVARLASLTIDHATDALAILGATMEQELTAVTLRDAAGRGLAVVDVDGGLRLTDVTVERSGGDGIAIDGGGPVTALGVRVADCGGYGLVRRDGALRLEDADLTGSGGRGDGVELLLGTDARGTVRDSRLTGSGEGIRLELTGSVVLEGNTLSGYRVALRTFSANPRIARNVFARVDTVLAVDGFRVPASVQLNVVESALVLVVNDTGLPLEVARNWWGTAESARIAAGMRGAVSWEPPLNLDPRLATAFALDQNYPNPFNGATVIDFSVPVFAAALGSADAMTLEVRTIAGGLVRRILERPAAPGFYHAVWDGRDEAGTPAASGVYFYELSVGRILLRQRLTVLR